MSQTIGSMAASVRATAGQFEQDLKQAGQSVDRFKHHVESSHPKGGLFGEGMAHGAGFELIHAAVEKAEEAIHGFIEKFEHVRELEHFAEKVSASASEISGLEFAAKTFGAGAESFDTGLKKMLKSIGDARGGLKETSDAFGALGLDVDKLASKSSTEAFLDIADAISKVPDAADRASLAVKIFSRGGVDLMNVLNQGRGEIEKVIEKGREIGAVLGEEDVHAAAEAAKAIFDMSNAWSGLSNKFITLVAPAVKGAADLINDLISGVRGLISHVDKNAARIVVFAGTFLAVINIIPKVISVVKSIITGIRALTAAVITAQAVSGPAGWATLAIGLATAAGAVALVNSQFDEFDKSASHAMEHAGHTAGEAAKSIAAEFQETESAAAAAKKATDALVKKGDDITKELRTPAEKFNDTMRELGNILAVRGPEWWETYRRAAEKASDELADATEKKKEFMKLDATPGVGSAQRGTAAAFSAVQASARLSSDLQRQQAVRQEQHLAEAKRQTDLQTRMLQALKDSVGDGGQVRAANI
jgi:hypothetical protein